ncbi:hypothetical protein [Leyella lascolaii]|uniref:hypothetical protein n=1 Tax=Leyella lascolaii TaxID=1776379 RepID=UPI00083A2CB1|nr:hypothetical protein [Leyella lascolaii]
MSAQYTPSCGSLQKNSVAGKPVPARGRASFALPERLFSTAIKAFWQARRGFFMLQNPFSGPSDSTILHHNTDEMDKNSIFFRLHAYALPTCDKGFSAQQLT